MLQSFSRYAFLVLVLGASLWAEPTLKPELQPEIKKDLKLSLMAGAVSGGAAIASSYLGNQGFWDAGMMAATQTAIGFGFQYYADPYVNWIGRPYRWETTSKGAFLSNMVKRAWVGALVIAGVNLVATYPGSGLEAHAPYTGLGFYEVLHGAAQMTLLSTPVNMALALYAKRIKKNGGNPTATIERSSFLVGAVQSGAMAANAGQQTTLGSSLVGGLAAVGSFLWAKEAAKVSPQCKGLEKLAQSH